MLERTTSLTPVQAFELAVRIAGSAKVAHGCRISREMVRRIRMSGRGVVPKYAPAIEAATDGLITCEQLCPQVHWQRDPQGLPVAYTVPVQELVARAAA